MFLNEIILEFCAVFSFETLVSFLLTLLFVENLEFLFLAPFEFSSVAGEEGGLILQKLGTSLIFRLIEER